MTDEMILTDEMTDELWTEAEEAQDGSFAIDNDDKAEWALKKIKDAQAEHSRLTALIDKEEERLRRAREAADKALENGTSHLKFLLSCYMQTVKGKETKTQKSYQLLTGKLVYKYGGTEYVKDDEELLNWTALNKPEYIKTKSSVDWANLKKELIVTESGEVIDSSGEILECVRAEKKPDKLDIKFTE